MKIRLFSFQAISGSYYRFWFEEPKRCKCLSRDDKISILKTNTFSMCDIKLVTPENSVI